MPTLALALALAPAPAPALALALTLTLTLAHQVTDDYDLENVAALELLDGGHVKEAVQRLGARVRAVGPA